MPNQITNVGFSQPNDYAIELADIERRKRLAEALQAKGAESSGGTEMVGGWAIPKSPWEGVGKMAQQASGAYQQNQLNQREQEIGKKYQSDLADTLMRANKAGIGTPAQAGSASPSDELGGGPASPDQPAVAGNREEMARILMSHPGTQGMGMQEMSKQMEAARIAAMLQQMGVGSSQADPTQALGAEAAAGGQAGPTNAAAGRVGAPNAGLMLDPMATRLIAGADGNPALLKLGELQQAAHLERSKPIVNRGYGFNVYDPATGTYPIDKGSLAGITAAETAKGAAQAPFSMQQMEVPIYLPGGDQIKVKMNATQAHQYQTTGNLPPEIAASIPGLQQKAPPQQPSPQQQGLTPPGGWQVPPAVQTQRDQQAGVIQARETMPNGGGAIPTPAVVGRPVVGRGQSENEQITQQRQAAGGKTADEAFAKDYVQFANGGVQDATKQLSQLQDVVTQLKDPKSSLTGPWMGSTPDAILKFSKTGQNAIAMRERVEEVVQRSLRAVLGAQFTEKEGERLIARAYNPNLPEKENAARVQRLFTQLEQSLEAKQSAANYFQKNNTLQGWQGKLPSMSDFDVSAKPGATGGWDAPTSPQVSAGVTRYDANGMRVR